MPIFQAIRSERMLKTALEYVRHKISILNLTNHLGKTPLVLVAEAYSTEENERIARMLLMAGADPKAG